MNIIRKTAVYAAFHFLTDFFCALLVIGFLAGRDPGGWTVFIYNFSAFALQLPAGAVMDFCGISDAGPAAGFCLLIAACLTAPVPWLSAVFAGIGNSLFHVGAGRSILLEEKEKCTPLGIFICPGAAGIFLGVFLGKNGGFSYLLLLLFISCCTILAFFFYFSFRKMQKSPQSAATAAAASGKCPEGIFLTSEPSPSIKAGMALMFLFIVVVLRSFMGAHMDFSWKAGFTGSALCTGALLLGKAAGGILADLSGKMKASVFSLLSAAALFLFSGSMAAGLLAVFLFNMTMPITMRGSAKWLPEYPGTAFGLLSFALFLGYLPDRFAAIALPAFFPSAACAVSLLLLAAGLRGTFPYKKRSGLHD